MEQTYPHLRYKFPHFQRFEWTSLIVRRVLELKGEHNVKLLIVDDEHIEREAMIAILSRAFPQFQYHQAKNGKQAVEMCQATERSGTIIITDPTFNAIGYIKANKLQQILKDYPMLPLS